MFVILDDFANREEPGLSADEIAAKLAHALRQGSARGAGERLPGAAHPRRRPHGRIQVHGRRPRRSWARKRSQQQANLLRDKADQLRGPGDRPLLIMQPNVFRANAPQLYADLNRAQCMTMGVPLADAFNTLQIYLGSLYVNDFNLFGRTWQVVVQADAKFRNQIDAAQQLKVRNNEGDMVPIGSLADVREVNGPLGPHPLQHVSGRRRQRQHRARGQFPAGHRPDAATGRQRTSARHALRMDRDGLSGIAGGQYGHGASSAWPW